MVSERQKDQIEDAASIAFQSAISLVPGMGPAGVLLAHALGSAAQRRNQAILDSLVQDIERFRDEGRLHDSASLVASEDFQAAFLRTVRAAQETSSTAKRALLRNALLNGIESPESDLFASLVVRYAPEHVEVLRATKVARIGNPSMLHSTQDVEAVLTEPLPDFRAYFRDLINDGLVDEEVENKLRPEIGSGSGATTIWASRYYSISDRGERFLVYVADPFGDDLVGENA
jgi:hypothetical protein